nr:hypothetical protein [Polymorphobacter sp. PAMC 29334]
MFEQQRDVALALGEAGKADLDDCQPVEQVLPEAPRRDRLGEIDVGRRDQPDVDREGEHAADALDEAGFEDSQQLDLELGGHVANLVEEQRAGVGELEAPAARLGGTSERPGLVPENLAFEEVAGNRGAVDRDERPGGAAAPLVKQLRDDLLAAPRRAGDKDRHRRRGELVDEGADLDDRGASPDQFGELGRRRRRGFHGEKSCW